ncbi:MAG: hypothetical protein VCF25_12140 [Candidatus Poribacteria bacterium]|mgnify:FL=1
MTWHANNKRVLSLYRIIKDYNWTLQPISLVELSQALGLGLKVIN